MNQLPLDIIQERYALAPHLPTGLLDKRTGKQAGSTARGYGQVKIGQANYQAHRIVFAVSRGFDPKGLSIDHIDRNPLNNDPSNLRVATAGLQTFNRDVACPYPHCRIENNRRQAVVCRFEWMGPMEYIGTLSSLRGVDARRET